MDGKRQPLDDRSDRHHLDVDILVGIGHFAHCIATSGEILAAVVSGLGSPLAYLHWLLFATMGNIVGGVTIVSLLNYGQVKAGETE